MSLRNMENKGSCHGLLRDVKAPLMSSRSVFTWNETLVMKQGPAELVGNVKLAESRVQCSLQKWNLSFKRPAQLTLMSSVLNLPSLEHKASISQLLIERKARCQIQYMIDWRKITLTSTKINPSARFFAYSKLLLIWVDEYIRSADQMQNKHW